MKEFKRWIKPALIRCVKTMSQTLLSLITVGTAMTDIDWITNLSITLVSGILSLLTSVAGLPELDTEETI